MTRRPPSKLDRLYKSHLKLLRAHRGVIDTMGHLRVEILQQRETIEELRKVILEMRQHQQSLDTGWAAFPPEMRPQFPKPPTTYGDGLQTVAWPEFDVPPNDWPRL